MTRDPSAVPSRRAIVTGGPDRAGGGGGGVRAAHHHPLHRPAFLRVHPACPPGVSRPSLAAALTWETLLYPILGTLEPTDTDRPTGPVARRFHTRSLASLQLPGRRSITRGVSVNRKCRLAS